MIIFKSKLCFGSLISLQKSTLMLENICPDRERDIYLHNEGNQVGLVEGSTKVLKENPFRLKGFMIFLKMILTRERGQRRKGLDTLINRPPATYAILFLPF